MPVKDYLFKPMHSVLSFFTSVFFTTFNYMHVMWRYIRYTKSPNLTVPRLVSQLSLPNPMKPGVNSRMNMKLEQRQQALLQIHLSDQQFYCLLWCVLYWRLYGAYSDVLCNDTYKRSTARAKRGTGLTFWNSFDITLCVDIGTFRNFPFLDQFQKYQRPLNSL